MKMMKQTNYNSLKLLIKNHKNIMNKNYGSFQYVDLPPVRSKQNPVLKDASLETINFVIEATSSKVQHLQDNNRISPYLVWSPDLCMGILSVMYFT